jgi:hypothetical protein
MAVLVSSRSVNAQESHVLFLETHIPLPNVKGRIDHLRVDLKGQRIFVAAVENHTLEIIDLKSGQRVHTIADLAEPQGVFFDPATNHLFVACGLDGVTKVFDATSFQALATMKLPDDADNIRYDPRSKGVIVGYAGAKQLRKRETGTGGLGFIDPNGRKTGDVVIDAHPESFQLEKSGSRIFVNVPAKKEIEVIDAANRSVLARWPVSAESDFPMALDESDHRLFIGVWNPPRNYWSLIPVQVNKSQRAKSQARRTTFSTIRATAACTCSQARGTSRFSSRKMPTTMNESRATPLHRVPRRVFLFQSGESYLLPSRRRITRVLKFVCIGRTDRVNRLDRDKQPIVDKERKKEKP